MNYLKSITSTVLASTGVSFPFAIGERIPGLEAGSSIWELREGTKKDDGTPLTLFIFDSTLPPLHPGNKDRKVLMQLARNALKKLRTIRHPDVIRYIDSVETETHVYIATERVRPLPSVLRDGTLTSSKGKAREDWIGFGMRSLATALAFLNSPPLSLHHAYLLENTAVFITPSMEWRLAGFELLTGRDDAGGVLWGLGGVAPGDVGERSAPEVRKGGWGVLRDTDPTQSDIYLLALLLFTLYNPTLPLPNLLAQPTPSSSGALPKSLFPLWKRMLNPNPRTRLTTPAFLSEATSAGFWATNPLTVLVEGLDSFELKSEGEKLSLLRGIKDAAGQGGIPQPFLLYKVLPSLLHSLSLPTAPSGAMLPLVLELGRLVPPAEYVKLVLEPVVRLYSSPDRGTRMALLDGLGEYSDKLDQRITVEKVWPHLITGFADTVPVIREATVKAVYPLASKLTDRILNNDLLRLLAKMQTDSEPSIRTNTCILLGRLAPLLSPTTRKKVLVPAFARSMRDSFVHARVAGLMALMATVECFDRDDLAGKVIPNMAFTMVDKEGVVREQAFKAMEMFMGRITEMVKAMPQTMQPENQSAAFGPVTTTSSASSANESGLVSSATGAAGALAGWAIASLGKQLNTSEAHSTLTAGSSASLAPPTSSQYTSPSASPRASSESNIFDAQPAKPSINVRKAAPSPRIPASSSSSPALGMKLGGKKTGGGGGVTPSSLAAEWEEDEGGGENPWGTDDLIDVNADADDWAAFESAPPTPEIVVPPPQNYYVNGGGSGSPAIKQTSPPKPARVRSPLIPSASPAPTPSLLATAARVATPKLPVAASPAASFDDWGSTEGGGDDSREGSPKPSSSSAGGVGGGPSLAGLSKEEKEREMARRREERKARIAAMKEQKKGKA